MIKRKNLIFVISAPSGTGKTTVSRKILAEVDGFAPSVSHTTRSLRSNEVDGKDYYFISKEEFKKKIDGNEFAEWNEYHSHFYGSSLENIERAKRIKKDLLFVIDVNGAANIRNRFDNGIYIFILPPSITVLRERLVQRGAESLEAIEDRIKIAKKEIQHFSEYDYVTVNHKIDETARKISSIIQAERCRMINLVVNMNGLTDV